MFHLPNNPTWNALVKAVRQIISFLLTMVFTTTGAGGLAAARSLLVFTGNALYLNTAWPNGSSYIQLWPSSGAGAYVLLPTEGGGFISAQFNDNDGSPAGNWYEEGTGNTVYFRPDTGLYYVWNPGQVVGYTIQLPGAVEWIEAEFKAMQNGFITPAPEYADISWESGFGWYRLPGAPPWRPIDAGEIGQTLNFNRAGIALRPAQCQTSNPNLVGATDANGNRFAAGYTDTVSGNYPLSPMPLLVQTYVQSGPAETARFFIYVFEGDVPPGLQAGWAEMLPYGDPGYPAVPVDGPDLSAFGAVSVTANNGAQNFLVVQD